MIPEALPRAKAEELYNPAYDNGHPAKTIELNGRTYLVHETSNLPDLIDAYFHEQQGFGHIGYQARAAHTKLKNPLVIEALQTILSNYPEYAKALEALTEARDQEYDKRFAARQGRRVPYRELHPSEEEQYRRDFIYSSLLDHIGDVNPDTAFLTEICS